jgi:phosphoglycolate phosphatase-like HAD superfamily hydrolase
MVEAVIFDVDGTLVDTVDFHAMAWQRTLAHFGREVAFAEVRGQIGKGGDQLMPVFLPKDMVEARGKEIEDFRKAIFARDYMPKVVGFPHVPDLFRALAGQGKRVALASSAKGDELDRYVQAAGIAGMFEFATSSDDAERSKPHPDIFEAALRRLGISGAGALVVGDTPYDAQAARKAGLATVGVLCGGFTEASLKEAGCIETWADPEALWRDLGRSALGR